MEREPLRFVNAMERSHLQDLSKTFTRSSKMTLPHIRNGLVKVTFPSHLQYLNGSLSKSLRSLKVYFRAVTACLFWFMVEFDPRKEKINVISDFLGKITMFPQKGMGSHVIL